MQNIDRPLYFKGLNGWRGLAALTIVFMHTASNMAAYNVGKNAENLFASLRLQYPVLANLAITFFFTLSGFLITYILLVEKSRAQINILKFYKRRILRIWPLYYAYIIITLAILTFIGYPYNLKGLPFYILFSGNIPYIFHFGIPALGHYWTLGVEEQFYIFWPWLVKHVKKLFLVCLILIAFQLLWKFYFHYINPHTIIRNLASINRFDCLLIGAVAAILFRKQHTLFLKVVNNKWVQVSAWCFLLFVCIFPFINLFDSEVFACLAVILIMGQINGIHPIINLEKPPLIFLGKISYGLYIIHPIIVLISEYIFPQIAMHGYFKSFIVVIFVAGISIMLATLSYYFLELRFINYKKKFMVVRSTATPQ